MPNSRSAPAACAGAPDSKVNPTTANGGTSEIAIATPGKVSEMSDRTRANAPTAPVASAAIRSTRWGSTRCATWSLVAATSGTGASRPSRNPMATTRRAPARTMSRDRRALRWSARTMANAVPRIGVISGATIIAPMTVAVEFDVMPAVAITAASGSNVQNLVELPTGLLSVEEQRVLHPDNVVSRDAQHPSALRAGGRRGDPRRAAPWDGEAREGLAGRSSIPGNGLGSLTGQVHRQACPRRAAATSPVTGAGLPGRCPRAAGRAGRGRRAGRSRAAR